MFSSHTSLPSRVSAPARLVPAMDVLNKVLADFDTAVDGAERALDPYLSVSLPAVSSRLAPIDNARLQATLATAVLSLTSGALNMCWLVRPRARTRGRERAQP